MSQGARGSRSFTNVQLGDLRINPNSVGGGGGGVIAVGADGVASVSRSFTVDNITVTNSYMVGDNLDVLGNMTVAGTMSAGLLAIGGMTNQGNLDVSGSLTVNRGANIKQTLVAENLVAPFAEVEHTLVVGGVATVEGALRTNTIRPRVGHAAVDVSGDLTVSGTLGLANLQVTGAFTAEAVSVTGDVTVGGTVRTDTIVSSSTLDISGSLAVTGATTLANLSVSDSMTVSSLAVTGDISAAAATIQTLTADTIHVLTKIDDVDRVSSVSTDQIRAKAAVIGTEDPNYVNVRTLDVSGTLGVSGVATFSAGVSTASISAPSGLTISGPVTTASTLTSSGLFTAANGVDISGGATLRGTTEIQKGLTVSGAAGITTTGVTTASIRVPAGAAQLDISGNTNVTGELTAGIFNVSTLNIDNNLDVPGTLTVGNGVDVSGMTLLRGATTMGGKLTVQRGGADLSGNTVLRGTTTSTGALTVQSGGATVTGNAYASGTLTAGGKLTVQGGGADVTGNTTLRGTTTSTGALTVQGGGAAVTGNTTVSGTIISGGKLTVQGGGADISGNVHITGNTYYPVNLSTTTLKPVLSSTVVGRKLQFVIWSNVNLTNSPGSWPDVGILSSYYNNSGANPGWTVVSVPSSTNKTQYNTIFNNISTTKTNIYFFGYGDFNMYTAKPYGDIQTNAAGTSYNNYYKYDEYNIMSLYKTGYFPPYYIADGTGDKRRIIAFPICKTYDLQNDLTGTPVEPLITSIYSSTPTAVQMYAIHPDTEWVGPAYAFRPAILWSDYTGTFPDDFIDGIPGGRPTGTINKPISPGICKKGDTYYATVFVDAGGAAWGDNFFVVNVTL